MSVEPSPSRAPRANIAAQVTAHIVELLANGVRPWEQPWSTSGALGLPVRAKGVAYRGVNVLILWAAAHTHGFSARRWISFKQAQALGGRVRRGEKATHIVFYSDGGARGEDDLSPPAATPAEAPRARRAILRTFAVFNADQVEGLPDDFLGPSPASAAKPTEVEAARLAARFADLPAVVEHGGARAYYAFERDVIRLPPPEVFHTQAQYYATLLHELGHWTGHASRLDRDLKPRAAHGAYAREELVAELTAAFLGAELGLPPDHIEDHAAYIDHYLKLLDSEPGALFAAAGKAQTAADFLRPHLRLAPTAQIQTTPARGAP